MKVIVFLDIDSKHPHFDLFSELGKKFEFKGRSVLSIDCEDADFSSPFVQLKIATPDTVQGLTVWVHSHHVILAFGESEEKPVGFSPSFTKKKDKKPDQ